MSAQVLSIHGGPVCDPEGVRKLGSYALLNGLHHARIVGRTLPYIDRATGTKGKQLYDVLLKGAKKPYFNITEDELV